MSRSIKKAIIKDKGPLKKLYHKIIRRHIKSKIRQTKISENCEDLTFINPKTLVNDYDYSDYTMDYEYSNYKYNEDKNKYKRK